MVMRRDLNFAGLQLLHRMVAAMVSELQLVCASAQRQANRALSAARAPVEHGFSDLKNWRILTRLRLDPGKATILLRALLVLTRQHTTR